MSNETAKKKWYFYLIITMLIWGTLSPVTRFLKDIPQGLFAFLRLGFAAMIVLVYVLWKRINIKIDKKDILYVLFVSIISGYLPPFLFNLGIKNTSSIIGSILINTNPLFVPIFSFFLLNAKSELKKFFYVLIGCIGVIIITLNNPFEFSINSDFFIGILYLLTASLLIGLNTVLGQKLVKKYSGITIGAYYIFVGAVCLLIQVIISGEINLVTALTQNELLLSIYVGVFPTAVVWILFLSSMNHLSATESATFKLLIPIFAAIFSILFIGESLTINLIIGGIIILFGLYNVQMKSPKEISFE